MAGPAPAWAVESKPGSVRIFPAAAQLEIHPKSGTLQQHFAGRGDKLVILLQDAHALGGAQKALHTLVRDLTQKYQIHEVLLEGASQPLDATLFRAYPEQAKLEKILGTYLDRGELSGAAAAAFESGPATVYRGMEDQALFEDGTRAYLRAAKHRKKFSGEISGLTEKLEVLKKKYYSAEALAFDRLVTAWRKEPQALEALLLELQRKFPTLLSSHASIQTVLKVLEPEQGVNAEALNQELSVIFQQLKMQASGAQAKKLNSAWQAYQIQAINRMQLVRQLENVRAGLPEASGVVFSIAVQALADHQAKLEALKTQSFFSEIETVLGEIRKRLLKAPEEQTLQALSRRLELLEKFSNFQITLTEWQELQARQNLFPRTTDLKAWLERFQAVTAHADFADYRCFYEIALQRDQVFCGKILKALAGKSPRAVIAVTGGFHTQGLSRILEQNRISYAVVTPKFDGALQERRYDAYMRGLVSWRAYFRPKDGLIDLHAAFTQALMDQLLQGSDAALGLKTWRDQLLRVLYLSGRLKDSSRYMRLLDARTTQTLSAFEIESRKKQWRKNLERFLKGLSALEKNRQLNETSVFQLLSAAGNQFPAAVPAGSIAADLVMLDSPLTLALSPEGRGKSAKLQEMPFLPTAAARSENRKLTQKEILGVMHAPKMLKTGQIPDAETAKQMNQRFLRNADAVIKLLDIKEYKIARALGVNNGTVRQWREVAVRPHVTISRYHALALTDYLLEEFFPKKTRYKRLALLSGDGRLTWKTLQQVFNPTKLEKKDIATIPKFSRAQIDLLLQPLPEVVASDAFLVNQHFIANATRLYRSKLAQGLTLDLVSKATGVGESTVRWWFDGRRNEKGDLYASIDEDNALRLARLLLRREYPNETDEKRLARLRGAPKLVNAKPDWPFGVQPLEGVFDGVLEAAAAKAARQNFLKNADHLLRLKDIKSHVIAKDLDVNNGTVDEWRSVWQNPGATITRHYALGLADFVLKKNYPEKTSAARLAILTGNPELDWRTLNQIFNPSPLNPREVESIPVFSLDDIDIKLLPLQVDPLTHPEQAKQHALRNAQRLYRVKKVRGLSDAVLAKAVGVSRSTIAYWLDPTSDSRAAGGQAAVRYENFKLLAGVLLGREFPGETGEARVRRLIGADADIPWSYLRAIFGKRSEVRHSAGWLKDLEHVDWNAVIKSREHAALLRYFLTEIVHKTPSDLVRQPDLLIHSPIPALRNQTLAGLYEHYQKEVQRKEETVAPMTLLLYDAGFSAFEGYEDARRQREMEKNISAEQKRAFQDIAENLKLKNWLKLFETHHMGLYFLLTQAYPQMDENVLVWMLSERFVDWEKNAAAQRDFSLSHVREMENHFFIFSRADEARKILISQIQDRLTPYFTAEAKQRRDRTMTIATQAVNLATETFEREIQRVQALAAPDDETAERNRAAVQVYTELLGHYKALKIMNYQQYVNLRNPEGAPQPLNLYQLEGIHYAYENERIVLGDEMGVGKTVQALGLAQAARARRVVIIASKTVLENWKKEIKNWLPDTALLEERKGDADPRDFIFVSEAGTARTEELKQALTQSRFVLINYEAFQQENAQEILEAINDWESPGQDEKEESKGSDLKIIDEAHRLRTEKNMATQAYFKIESRRALNLTGSVVFNEEADLFPLLHSLDPDHFPNSAKFRADYPETLAGRTKLNLEMHRRGLLKRRLKKNVLTDLPELKPIEFREVELDQVSPDGDIEKSQSAVYGRIDREFQQIDADVSGDVVLLAKLTQLRKAALDLDFFEGNGPAAPVNGALYDPESPDAALRNPYRYPNPGRYEMILDQIQEAVAEGGKVVLFSEFYHPLRRILWMLRERYREHEGGLPPEAVVTLMQPNRDEPVSDAQARFQMVIQFNTQPATAVFASTTGVGGEGLNLVGGNYFMGVDLPYTDARLRQAIERLHRPGQTRAVTPIVFFADGTWEAVMKQIVAEKKTLQSEVVDGTLTSEGITKKMVRQIQDGRRAANAMRELLSKIQTIYSGTYQSGDWRQARSRWNEFAREYSENVERLAAFPIAQILFTRLLQQGFLRPGMRLRSTPAGPETDWRALHSLEPVLRDAGLSIGDFELISDDFSEAMQAEGRAALDRLGLRAHQNLVNLVEDELPQETADLVINSEMLQYGGELNSHNVAQRNWMLAQLVKTTRVDGHLLLWVHNGFFTSAARQFLTDHFGLEIVDYGKLSLNDMPALARSKLKKMTFILARRVTADVDLSARTLQQLPPDGLTIVNGRRTSMTHPEEVVEVLRVNGGRGLGSASIAEFIKKGGTVEAETPPDPIDTLLPIERTLYKLRLELNSLLEVDAAHPPNEQTVKQIVETVHQILEVSPHNIPKASYLQGVAAALRLVLRQDPGQLWRSYAELIRQQIVEIEVKLEQLAQGPKRTVIPEDTTKARKTAKDGGDHEGQPPYKIAPQVIAREPLLAHFAEQGFTFFETYEGIEEGIYASDVRLDETSKIFWVNRQLVRTLSAEKLALVLRLKAWLHLDSLYPQNRLEAAFVGLDRLQADARKLQERDEDLALLDRLNLVRQEDLFLFFLSLRDLPRIGGQPAVFQPQSKPVHPALERFISYHRNNILPVDFSKKLNSREASLIQQNMDAIARGTGDLVEKLSQNFNRWHGSKFQWLIAQGGATVIREIPAAGKTAAAFEVIHKGETETLLAKLKKDAKTPPGDEDVWDLNWLAVGFSGFAGDYAETDAVARYSAKTGEGHVLHDQGVSLTLPQLNGEGLLLLAEPDMVRSPEPKERALLLRRLDENRLGIFQLEQTLEVGNGQQLSVETHIFSETDTLRPLAILDARKASEETVSAGHTHFKMIRTEEGAPQLVLTRDIDEVGEGENVVAAFSFSAQRFAAKSEVRRMLETGAGIDRSLSARRASAHAIVRSGETAGRLAARLQKRFESLLADSQFVTKALALEDRPVFESYRRFSGLEQASEQSFRTALENLNQSIRSGRIQALAPVIFIDPGMMRDVLFQQRLRRFIQTVYEAFEAQGDARNERFRFHLISQEKDNLIALIQTIDREARPAVDAMIVDESAASWKTLARQLDRTVFQSPRFREHYGVFFPDARWLAQTQKAEAHRMVQSDLAARQAFVLVPGLSRYYGEIRTQEINAATLRQALPEYAGGLVFSAGTGIRILVQALSQMIRSARALARSA